MPKETNIWEQVRKLQCGILFLRRIERSSQFEFEILIQLIQLRTVNRIWFYLLTILQTLGPILGSIGMRAGSFLENLFNE